MYQLLWYILKTFQEWDTFFPFPDFGTPILKRHVSHTLVASQRTLPADRNAAFCGDGSGGRGMMDKFQQACSKLWSMRSTRRGHVLFWLIITHYLTQFPLSSLYLGCIWDVRSKPENNVGKHRPPENWTQTSLMLLRWCSACFNLFDIW